jgi:hypothetical protein
MHFKPRPLTMKQANKLVSDLHRHHKPVHAHRFSIGAEYDGKLCGAVIVGRPVARMCDPYLDAEVVRLVTDGTKNACSFLYATAARIAREMGFKRIQTYILDTESGVSLLASGWKREQESSGGDWNRKGVGRDNRRTDQPQCPKQRWAKTF